MKARDVEALLIFCVIQPAIFFFAVGVFLSGIYQSIWG